MGVFDMITGIYASILALLFLCLFIGVVSKRLKYKIGIGDGNNHALSKAIRVHANFAEHVPYALLMMLLCELTGISIYFVHAFGVTLVTARLMHAYGLTRTSQNSWGRSIGIIATYVVIVMAAILLLLRHALAYI